MSQTVRLGPAEIDALSRLAVAEAMVDGRAGMQAVAAVVMNRAATNRPDLGGQSILGVIGHPGQFTPVTRAGGVNNLPPAPENIERMVAEFVSTFSPATDPTKGATFFNADNSNRFPSHVTIGGHTFHKGYNNQRVDVPEFQPALSQQVAQQWGVTPTRTARAATPPSRPDQVSLLDPSPIAGQTARQAMQVAGVTPTSRPGDIAAPAQIESPMRYTERVTSGFGMRTHPVRGGQRMHPGVDISRKPGEIGASVYAMEPGVVDRVTSPRQGLGRVDVRHQDGRVTSYLHVSPTTELAPGATIAAGQQIASIAPRDRFSTAPHLDVRQRDAQGNWVNIEPSVRAALARQATQAATVAPPSPEQAVAARARAPAGLAAFVEPPEPAANPNARAAAPATVMTDVAQNAPPSASRQVVSSGMTPANASATPAPSASRQVASSGMTPANAVPSTPARSAAPARDVQGSGINPGLAYAPDVDRASRVSGGFALTGPAAQAAPNALATEALRAGAMLSSTPAFATQVNPTASLVSPSVWDRGPVPSVPQADAPRAVVSSGLTPASVYAPATRSVTTTPQSAVARAMPGAAAPVPSGLTPPSRQQPATPAPSPSRARAPMDIAAPARAAPPSPERAFQANPNSPIPAFDRGAAAIGNFVESNTRGIRSGLNDRFGDYYGGNMFAPSYSGPAGFFAMEKDAFDRGYIDPSGVQRGGPGAEYGLRGAYSREFGGMSRGGRLAGNVLGGILGGPPGAIVGGILGGMAGERMGFGRDRNAPDRGILSGIGDFFGGIFSGPSASPSASASSSGGMSSGGMSSGGMSGDSFGGMGGLGGMRGGERGGERSDMAG